MKFSEITAAAFFGKALKIAQGFGHTHASRGLADLKELGRCTLYLTGNGPLAEAVAGANTARHALQILTEARAGQVVAHVGAAMLAALREYAGPGPEVNAVVLDFDGSTRWRGGSPGEVAA
jgi:cobalt-precorrin-5B (C1)-methyltransferase